MRTRMAPKKYHPEFVCRMVCAVHTSKPQFILIQSSHLIWCWNCVVLLWVLAAFFTHQSIESIVSTVNFVALNRDFIMHFVCVCCPCPLCVCVRRGVRIDDKINIYENGFISVPRTHTNTLVDPGECCLCFLFFYSNYCRTTQQEISASMKWYIVNVVCTNRTEQNIDMFIGSTIDKRNEKRRTRKSLSHTSQPIHSGRVDAVSFCFSSNTLMRRWMQPGQARSTTLINLVYRIVYMAIVNARNHRPSMGCSFMLQAVLPMMAMMATVATVAASATTMDSTST